MSNIVKKRELYDKNKKNNSSDSISDSDSCENIDNEINQNNQNPLNSNIVMQNKLLNKIAKKVDDEHVDSLIVDIDKNKDDKITLSYILNVIDGIRETPGRILIITSNDYNSLDPALIRPGRIDMTLEMKNASVDVIKEMYNHYYNDIIPDEMCKKMKDYVISHAKIVNLRLEHDNKLDFLAALLKEF